MKDSKRRGLGTGLDQLLGSSALEEPAVTTTLSVAEVQPGLNQPRKNFDPQAISDLADSIRNHGIIQPLTVRRLDSGYYQIIAGERRWRAAKEAELKEVPVLVIEANDKKVMELGLIENLQREDLNPVEEARGYQVLMKEYNLTQEEVAESIGKSRPAIANALRLLGLTAPVLEMLEKGALSSGHARALLGAPSEKIMEEVAEVVIRQELSVRKTEELVRNMKKAYEIADDEVEIPKEETDHSRLYVEAAAENLTQRLGRRVMIQQKGNRGKIVLEYSDEHDLTDLVERLESLQEGTHE